jgi:acyl carrier protein
LNKIEYTPPKSNDEKKICNIWQEILGVTKIGITDDFFRLGGNSILAIQLITKMNHSLKIKLSVSDIFRCKNIRNIMATAELIHKGSLIKPLNTKNKILPIIYFLHPSGSGSEVYQELADLLEEHYQSIGVDNYNICNDDKIDNLYDIANYYIDEISKKFPFFQDVYLCGWSLGGQIALEMAYQLEQKGFHKIKIYLLDTILFNDEEFQNLVDDLDIESLNLYRKKKLFNQKIEAHYIEIICSAYEAEASIINCSISGVLNYTKVILFKAKKINNEFNNETHLKIEKYKCSKYDNNIQKIVKNKLEVELLNCHHANILKKSKHIIRSLKKEAL